MQPQPPSPCCSGHLLRLLTRKAVAKLQSDALDRCEAWGPSNTTQNRDLDSWVNGAGRWTRVLQQLLELQQGRWHRYGTVRYTARHGEQIVSALPVQRYFDRVSPYSGYRGLWSGILPGEARGLRTPGIVRHPTTASGQCLTPVLCHQPSAP